MASEKKSKLYSREEPKKKAEPTPPLDQNLEGTSFGPANTRDQSGDQRPLDPNPPYVDNDEDDEEDEEDEEEYSSSSEEEIDDDTDIFSPEFVRSRCVNMPELVELIKDPEILEHLNNPKVTEYLREISLDPNNKIPELCDTPEIAFLKKKMEDLVKKTYPDAQVPVHFEKPIKN